MAGLYKEFLGWTLNPLVNGAVTALETDILKYAISKLKKKKQEEDDDDDDDEDEEDDDEDDE